jgi:hypothetical protein
MGNRREINIYGFTPPRGGKNKKAPILPVKL